MEEIRLDQSESTKEGLFNHESTAAAYATAFREHGLRIADLAVDDAARRVSASPIRPFLLSALDNWANIRPAQKSRLLAIAIQAEDDSWTRKLRDATARDDRAALLRMAQEPDALRQSVVTVQNLGDILARFDPLAAVKLLGEVQLRHPQDLWINHELAGILDRFQPPRANEAIGYFRTALAIRPQSSAIRHNLGRTFKDAGQLAAAIAVFREAIQLAPDACYLHSGISEVLLLMGRPDEAVAESRTAIRLSPDHPAGHTNLAAALLRQRKLDEAITEANIAIRLAHDDVAAYSLLARALEGKGQLEASLAQFREVVRLEPDGPKGHFNLGLALIHQGRIEDAIAVFQNRIERNAMDCLALRGRARCHALGGRIAEARADQERAITIAPDDPDLNNDLAWRLANDPELGKRDPMRAVLLATRAVELAPTIGNNWNTLGAAHCRAGDWKRAIEALTKSMELGSGGDGNDWFFLAMAYSQLRDMPPARSWYNKAVGWMEKNQPKDEELIRLRAEAAALLGVNVKKD